MRRLALSLVLACGGIVRLAAQQADSAADHVPPPAPEHPMPSMSDAEMTDAMEMDDRVTFAMFKLDRLERADTDEGVATAWKLSAWAGGDSDKILLRSEGEHVDGDFEYADAELLWDHAIASYWDTQLGARHDFGRGADRSWAAFGVQGLAPYWFEISATAYVGDSSRTAFRLEVDYELALTQRLILQPRLELNAYGRPDPAAGIGAGVSDAALGLRLRYEIRREIAPYVGIERVQRFGATADLAEAAGERAGDTQWVVGLRLWY